MANKKIKKQNICSICQAEYEGFGNNAEPINDGRCCDNCNWAVVVPARINRIKIYGQIKTKKVA